MIREQPLVPPVKEFLLTLTPREAGILRSILGKFYFGGPTHPIFVALAHAKVESIRGEISYEGSSYQFVEK